MTRPSRPARLLAGAGLVVVLAGCAGSGGAEQSSAGSARSAAGSAAAPMAAPDAGKAAAAGPAVTGVTASGGTPATGLDDAATADRSRIRTAALDVEVKDLDRAAAVVRSAATAAGGYVGSEEDGTKQAVLVLRVPEPRLDLAVAAVVATGKELDRRTSDQDVTGDLADLASRTATAQASVARVRTLLAKASSLQDVVLLEGELTKREADLEAAQARQRSLAGQATLATLTATLTTPGAPVPVRPAPGFLSGLRSGWHALAVSTVAVLTVLGAVLPILVVLIAIGVPAYLLLRRFRPRRAAVAAPAPAAQVATDGGPVP